MKRILQSVGLAVALALSPALHAQGTGAQARAILERAIANQEKPGELKAALLKLDALAGHGTSDAMLEYARGWVLSHMERPVDAVTAYRHAIKLDPTFVAAHYNLGVLLTSNPTTKEEALHYFETAARLDPRNADASFNAGQADYDLERYDAAVKQWAHTQQLTPNDVEVVRKLIQALNALGRWAEAAAWRDYALRMLGEQRDPSVTSICIDQIPLKLHRVYVYENLDPAKPYVVYFCRITNTQGAQVGELNLVRDGASHYVLIVLSPAESQVASQAFAARPAWSELKPMVRAMAMVVLKPEAPGQRKAGP